MSKIQIVTGRGTEQAGQALANAIEQRTGAQVGISHADASPTLRDIEQFGSVLDALAVLRETEKTLRQQALQLIADHPKLIRGSKTLTLDDRVANTLSNRRIIQERMGSGRTIDTPEQLIIGGAAIAAGADQWSVLAHVATNAMEPGHTTAGQYRDQLNTTLGPAESSHRVHDFFEAAQDELEASD